MCRASVFVGVVSVLLGCLFLVEESQLLRPFPLSHPLQPDRVIVVCGASKGIGKEVALRYAREGAKLFIVATNQVKLAAVAEEAQQAGAAQVEMLATDLSSTTNCQSVIDSAVQAYGHIDVLVLNHVIGYWDHILRETPQRATEIAERLFRVNALSYVTLALAALPHLSEGGDIAVISSATGRSAMPRVAPYSATKHYLHGFFNSLRQDLAIERRPVFITICVLGSIDTENNRKSTGRELPDLPRVSAASTADAIVASVSARQREMMFPAAEVRPVVFLSHFIPNTLESLIRTYLNLPPMSEAK